MEAEQWYALPMNNAIQERLNKCGVVWIPTSGVYYEDDSHDSIIYEGMVATFPLSAREGIEECLQHSFDYEDDDSVYMNSTLGVPLLTTSFIPTPMAEATPGLDVSKQPDNSQLKDSCEVVTKPARLRRKRGNKISYSTSSEIRWDRDKANQIMQKYADDWGVDIKVTCPHGSVVAPALYSEGAMNVLIYSTPADVAAHKGRAKVRLGGREQTVVSDSLTPKVSAVNPMNIPIYDEAGRAIAIMVNKSSIYIGNDICHYPDYEDQYVVLAYTFAEADKIIKSGFDCSGVNEAMAKVVIHEIEKSFAGLANQYKGEIRNAEDRYTNYMQCALQEEVRRRHNIQMMAAFDIGKMKGKAEAVVRNILAINGVASISKDGVYIKVETDPLAIKEKEDMYYIGRYAIHLDPNSNSLPSISSLDSVGGHPHPHINGGVCWGNIGDGILKLIASKDFDIALQLILQYLCTVYSPDTYYPITDWPLLSKCSQQEQEEAVYVG